MTLLYDLLDSVFFYPKNLLINNENYFITLLHFFYKFIRCEGSHFWLDYSWGRFFFHCYYRHATFFALHCKFDKCSPHNPFYLQLLKKYNASFFTSTFKGMMRYLTCMKG